MAFNSRTPNDVATHVKKYSSLAQLVNKSKAGAIGMVNGVFYHKASTGSALPVGMLAYGRAVAQTAAVASVLAYTVGAADSTFDVSANVLVTTSTTHAFNVECAYTDEGNTARTLTLPFVLVAGSAIVNSIAAAAAVPYMGLPVRIRAKAATTITIRTQAAGTYTTVTYNIEGGIRQTA